MTNIIQVVETVSSSWESRGGAGNLSGKVHLG